MVPREQSDFMQRIIKLRYLVGFLGEKSQCNWWPTSFYEASSIRFLEPVFSRTAPLAQYHGAVEAARRFHDENLSVGSFHIFRLPEEIEQDLHEMVQAQLLELFVDLPGKSGEHQLRNQEVFYGQREQTDAGVSA